ncbi:MAG: Smr/MutS family protein [Spirochaetales bacterium]|nr:Smr/MutS family protein [Spirochaetales bacterium]
MEDLLNLYPPGKGMASEKEKSEIRKPSDSPGRKTLEKMSPQTTLDIHGLKGEEAKKEVLSFIRKCRKRGIKKGLIIHGKGLHSPDGAVLRPMVRKLLDSHPQIKNWGKAPRNEGGEGATWFIL